jgi:hypothetical protein
MRAPRIISVVKFWLRYGRAYCLVERRWSTVGPSESSVVATLSGRNSCVPATLSVAMYQTMYGMMTVTMKHPVEQQALLHITLS